MTVNLEDIARQKGIRSFLISYTDLFGVQRAKLVPAAAINAMAKAGPIRTVWCNCRGNPRWLGSRPICG
jgi:glutamine synthetase